MPDEDATAELVRALYAALAAGEAKAAVPIDGLAELIDRYDEQFREFRIEPLEVVARAEKAFVKVRIGGLGLSGAEQWSTGYHVHTVAGGKLVSVQVFAERSEAAEAAGLPEAG
jgi:ketosteroid isomerase-like protein